MCALGLPPQLSKTMATYLFQFPADGIDNKVAFFLSDMKQAPQLRKIEMTDCQYLSPSLIATVCGGLYTSNSIEEVEVALVSARLDCLIYPILIMSIFYFCLYAALKSHQHLFGCTGNGWRPFLSHYLVLCDMLFSHLQLAYSI